MGLRVAVYGKSQFNEPYGLSGINDRIVERFRVESLNEFVSSAKDELGIHNDRENLARVLDVQKRNVKTVVFTINCVKNLRMYTLLINL